MPNPPTSKVDDFGTAFPWLERNLRLDTQVTEIDASEAVTGAPGARVLVIDDSNTIRRSAEIFLRQGGHEVLLAEDGFDALAKVNDHAPELIFCDILMPRLDGYQTCAIIKRNPRFAHVPVIMLSSKDGLFDKARGRMVGSEDYLTKPFTKDQLLRAVQQYCRVNG